MHGGVLLVRDSVVAASSVGSGDQAADRRDAGAETMSETKQAPLLQEKVGELLKVSPKVVADDGGSIWLHTPTGVTNLSFCFAGPISRDAFLRWGKRIEKAIREVEAVLKGSSASHEVSDVALRDGLHKLDDKLHGRLR